MLIYANAPALAAPGTGVCSELSMPGALTAVGLTAAQRSAVATKRPVGAAAKQTWQPKPFGFPTLASAHHNSMDLGTVIRDAGSAVRTDAGRPPRGVPR